MRLKLLIFLSIIFGIIAIQAHASRLEDIEDDMVTQQTLRDACILGGYCVNQQQNSYSYYPPYPQPAPKAQPPQKPSNRCGYEGLVKSHSGGNKKRLDFYNLTNEYVWIYWLDYDGERVLYKDLAGFQNYSVNTWDNHPWLIADENDHCIRLIESSYGVDAIKITNAH